MTPKRRGAQPGNKNALKHGLYADWYSLKENAGLSTIVDLKASLTAEIEMLRVLMTRALKYLAEPTKVETFLDCVTVLTATASRVGRLIQIHSHLTTPTGHDESKLFAALAQAANEIIAEGEQKALERELKESTHDPSSNC